MPWILQEKMELFVNGKVISPHVLGKKSGVKAGKSFWIFDKTEIASLRNGGTMERGNEGTGVGQAGYMKSM